MAFQFPANPTVGQQYAPATGTTYEWNGTGWIFLGLNTASLYPAGIILPYAGGEGLPFQGWLLCDGKSYATAAYPTLFAIINYWYGGSGANFNVPDLRGRVVAGADAMGGSAANRLTVLGGLTGAGGAQHIALSTGELPAHSHGITDVAHSHGVSDPTHAHGVYDPSHAHGHALYDPWHSHGVSDPTHAHGHNNPGHSHGYSRAGSQGNQKPASSGTAPYDTEYGSSTDPATLGLTIYGSGTGIGVAAGPTGITLGISAAGTGIGIYGAGTGIGIAASGTGISGTHNTGSGGGHLNVQPTIVLNYLIKA